MIESVPLSDALRKAMIAEVKQIGAMNPRLLKIIEEAKEIIDASEAMPGDESPFPDEDTHQKIRFFSRRGTISLEGVLVLSPDGSDGPWVQMRVTCDGLKWDWSKLQIRNIMFVFMEKQTT